MKKYIYFLPTLSFLLSSCASHDKHQATANTNTYTIAVSPTGAPNPDYYTPAVTIPPFPISTAPTLSPEINKEPAVKVYEDGSTVAIVKSDEANASDITEAEIDELVNNALNMTDEFRKLIKNGQTVVIKPNLVQMIVDSTGELLDKTVNGITTDWRVAHAVVKNVRKLNPDGKIYVMECSATGKTKDVMAYYNYTPDYMPEVDGFFGLEEDSGAWQDFNAPELVRAPLPDGLLHQEYYFNKILYNADVLISIPCLKTTSGVIVTGGIKNVYVGAPPGNIYGVSATNAGKTHMVSHKITDGDLDKWIYDYYRCKPIDYVVVDGLQGFQSGPVPMGRAEKDTDKMNMRIILAGCDIISVDTVNALIMGWDPLSIGYLNHFAESGIGHGNPVNIHVLGEMVGDLRKPFTVKHTNLGGALITQTEGPEIYNVELSGAGDDTDKISLQADNLAVKAELYVNGAIYANKPVENGGCVFALPKGLVDSASEVKILVYDRFLNMTETDLEIGVAPEPGD